MVVPNTKGLNGSFKSIYTKLGYKLISKQVTPPNISQLLQGQRHHHTGKLSDLLVKCDRVMCDEEYIGESTRAFGKGLKEHLKALSSMTMPTPQDIPPVQTTSILQLGNHITSL